MAFIRRGLWLALAATAAAGDVSAQTSTPVNEQVLAWPAADTLYLSRNVLGRPGCAASGVYALVLQASSLHPLRIGEGACDLVGTVHGAAVTRDGTQVVGMRAGIGPVVANLADGVVRRLAIGCRIPAFEPAISPDGRWLAFDAMCEAGSEQVAIHVMPMEGGAHRTVTSEPGWMLMAPQWSPDGRRLAYVRAPEPGSAVNGDEGIAVVDGDGGERRVLATGGNLLGGPAWSPDGRWLAYIADDAIHVIGADGAGGRQVFRSRRRPRSVTGVPGGALAWSPDGAWIAFSRSHPNGQSVWRVRVADGTVEPLTRHEAEGR